MKKVLFLFVVAALLAAPAWADLGDDVKKEEQKNKDDPKKDDQSSSSSSSSSDSSDSNPFAELIARLVVMAWAADNVWTTFEDHPYAGGSTGFVRWPDADTNGGGPVLKAKPGRDGWLTVGGSFSQLSDVGRGSWVTVQGQTWRFFGPYLEAWNLGEGSRWYGGARLGATFSLIQADPFNLAFYGQFDTWYGFLKRQGGAFGLQLRTFPFRPVVLEARLGAQAFENYSIGELEFQAGWLLDRYELFAGYRSWGLNADAGYTGFFTGLRAWL